MLEKDLSNLDNEQLVELLSIMEEMEILLAEQESLLKGSDNNES